jgi:uncharacterized protein YodC (DUF2158 family)
MAEFRVGDVVRLKGVKGPDMTVTHVAYDDSPELVMDQLAKECRGARAETHDGPPTTVTCSWFSGTRPQNETFPVAAVVKVEPEKTPPGN